MKEAKLISNLYLQSKCRLQIQREVKIMNKYESIIIVNPSVDEAGLKALEEKFTGLINENGKVESTENMGNVLNESLIFQKEGFGGRGVIYDIYEYNLK